MDPLYGQKGELLLLLCAVVCCSIHCCYAAAAAQVSLCSQPGLREPGLSSLRQARFAIEQHRDSIAGDLQRIAHNHKQAVLTYSLLLLHQLLPMTALAELCEYVVASLFEVAPSKRSPTASHMREGIDTPPYTPPLDGHAKREPPALVEFIVRAIPARFHA